jgi:hypothetical protein
MGSEFLNPAQSKVSGFDRVTGSPESILIIFLNQNDIVLVKKKKNKSQWVATGFLTESCGSPRVLTFPLFS